MLAVIVVVAGRNDVELILTAYEKKQTGNRSSNRTMYEKWKIVDTVSVVAEAQSRTPW